MPFDKREPDMSAFHAKVEPPKLPQDSGLFSKVTEIKAQDPNAVAGVRIAEAIQKLVAHEDPVAVLLALGLQVGATVARQSPPDFANGMAAIHTVARVELRRRRPGLKV